MKGGPAAGTLAPMVAFAALWVVALAGVFLAALGLLGFMAPQRVRSFLGGFAASLPRHCLELCIRFAMGWAFVVAAPHLALPALIASAGWILLGTTVFMALVPWRIHRGFAQRTVPRAMAWLPLIAVVSTAAGAALVGLVLAGIGGA